MVFSLYIYENLNGGLQLMVIFYCACLEERE